MVSMRSVQSFIKKADPEGGQGVWSPPGKSQVAIGFLRNTSTDPWVQLLLEGGLNGPL